MRETAEWPGPERRSRHRHGRRMEDEDALEPEQLRGFAFWAKLMVVHHGKVAMVVSLLTGVGGYLLGIYGLNVRVANLEHVVQVTVERVDDMRREGEVNRYMLCRLVTRVDPPAPPSTCGTQNPPQGGP